ncbi:MAG: DegV family protein [Ruminiclostridium sp.]|nr:DegV family protein [Ruminiclostridium sp.]
MTWNIVCDSSSDLLPAELIPGKLYRKVAPLTLLVGDKEYVDDATLDVPTLLAHMAAEKGPSSSACPSPDAYYQAFVSADCSVCITISGNLSGSFAAAVTARDMVLEEFPEKKICLVDSCSTSGALSLLDRMAQRLIAEDENDFEGISEKLLKYRDEQYTVYTLECFDNLIKNGRMKPLLGTILHTLGIHVIADATPEGTIRVLDKARGEKKTYRGLVEKMAAFKDYKDAEVIVSHCQNPAGAEKMKAIILETLPVKSVDLQECRGLNTFYAMDQGIIISG